MCTSAEFGLITNPNKITNFFGDVIPVLVWKKIRDMKIYLLDFSGKL